MKTKNIILIISAIFCLALVISLSFINALEVDFFYNEGCPYCQNIKPLVQQLEQKPNILINYFETSNPEYQKLFLDSGFKGVPSFLIKTDDNREIKFTGADEQKIKCEVMEMSSKDCPTYSADNCIKGSWFK